MRHFNFGNNWAKYVKKIDDSNLNQSIDDLIRLLGMDDLSGKTVIDIGSGSGLHSAALYSLNPLSLESVDYDLDSVGTTKNLLLSLDFPASISVRQADILDKNSFHGKKYDVVYSWGVLHHTGDLDLALKNSASLVENGGILAIALYHKTFFCKFWKIEKRIYSKSPYLVQRIIFFLYISLLFLDFLVIKRRNFFTYVKNYKSSRGMNFFIDAHDWLGGYPYESISPQELRSKMKILRFQESRSFTQPSGLGLFGSGCDEFVFKKSD
jgi:2-polyprenyl-6-hydroxyphenyl methylase/3-demethylubiquinone-9 3-methyltransferase